MGIKKPYVDIVKRFGAILNDPSQAARARNSDAFDLAQNAMKNDPESWGHPLFVPSGKFYLERDLHISKSLELFGTGPQGESILVLPRFYRPAPGMLACLAAEGMPAAALAALNALPDREFLAGELMDAVTALIGADAAQTNRSRILKCTYSRATSIIVDPATNAAPSRTGAECVLRDLQLHCDPMWTRDDGSTIDMQTLEGPSTQPPAIFLQTTATIRNVLVRGFWGSGVYIWGGDGVFANQWRVHDVYINECGGHGMHVEGGEAQGGLCTGTKAIAIGGNGFYERAEGGNTYVGCYAEEVRGRGFLNDSIGQPSFIGCFAEAANPTRLLSGVFVGGNPGFMTQDTRALVAPDAFNVQPLRVSNQFGSDVVTLLGLRDASNTVLGWQTKDEDAGQQATWFIRWNAVQKIWETWRSPGAGGLASQAAYLSGEGHPRGAGLQGFPALLLGPANAPAQFTTTQSAAPAANDQPAQRHFQGSWQQGDRIYDATPNPGGREGWVCVQDGADQADGSNTAVWKGFGSIEG